MKCIFEREENIMGIGQNAGSPALSPFPILFSKGFFLKVVKILDCVVKS